MALRELLIAGSVASLAVGTIAYAQVSTEPVIDELATELLTDDTEQLVEISDRDRKRDRKDCDDDDHDGYEDDDENEDEDDYEDDDDALDSDSDSSDDQEA